jgi:hypothetical protein
MTSIPLLIDATHASAPRRPVPTPLGVVYGPFASLSLLSTLGRIRAAAAPPSRGLGHLLPQTGPKTPTGLALSRPLGPVGGIRAREAGVGTAPPSQDFPAGPVLARSKNGNDLGEGLSQGATGTEVGSRDSNIPRGGGHGLPAFLPYPHKGAGRPPGINGKYSSSALAASSGLGPCLPWCAPT